MTKGSCLVSTLVPPTLYVQLLSNFYLTNLQILQDLMQIGDGATGTITNPNKQGGLVAIYYLGTLLGALMYVFERPPSPRMP